MYKRFYVVVARDQVEDYLQQALGVARNSVAPEKDMGFIRGLLSNALNNLHKQEEFEGNMDQDLSLIRRDELKRIAHSLGADESKTRGKSVKELKALVESLTHTPSGASALTSPVRKMAYAKNRLRRFLPH